MIGITYSLNLLDIIYQILYAVYIYIHTMCGMTSMSFALKPCYNKIEHVIIFIILCIVY